MRHISLVVSLMFICFNLVACNSQQNVNIAPKDTSTPATHLDCPGIMPTPSPLPEFLERIYPSETVTRAEYEAALLNPNLGGISIIISAYGIDRSVFSSDDTEYRINTMSERITIFVDNILISNNLSTIGDGLVKSGPFYFSWTVSLDAGYHTTNLVFKLDTGEIKNYEWSFCITP